MADATVAQKELQAAEESVSRLSNVLRHATERRAPEPMCESIRKRLQSAQAIQQQHRATLDELLPQISKAGNYWPTGRKRSTRTSTQAQVDALGARISELHGELNKIAALETAKTLPSADSMDVDEAGSSSVPTTSTAVEELMDQVNSLRQRVDAVSRQGEATIQDIQTDMEERFQRFEADIGNIADLQSQITGLQDTSHKIQELVASLEGASQEIYQQREQAGTQLAEAVSTSADIEKRCNEVRTRFSECNSRRDTYWALFRSTLWFWIVKLSSRKSRVNSRHIRLPSLRWLLSPRRPPLYPRSLTPRHMLFSSV
jgi:chromosome segregation ATPase